MPGPPPKPLEQKRLTGNPGKRPLPDRRNTIALAPATARPPAGLGTAGRKLWRHIATLKWLAESDQAALAEMCALADQVATARKTMTDEGQYYEVRGRLLPHPAVGVYHTGLAQLTKMLSLFGLTPADRTRLGIAEIKAESKFDELMARRNDRATS